MLAPRFRRDFDPVELLAMFPPELFHPHKRLVFGLACPAGSAHGRPITVTRWRAAPLPPNVALAPTEITPVAGYYDYGGDGRGVWHVNFADPQLFVAYGSALLAQDELQAAEHPLLGPVRQALLAAGEPALTEERGEPTPVLVAGVERRCAIATDPDPAAGRPFGLYGYRFAAAPSAAVRAATRVLTIPTRSNLIAISAPVGAGRYTHEQITHVLVTAYTGFSAAVAESKRAWPGTPVEIRTGFWGCGAFGGNRQLMTLLQLLAARLAGVHRMRFYTADERGHDDFHAGVTTLVGVLGGAVLANVIDRIVALKLEWGESDGN